MSGMDGLVALSGMDGLVALIGMDGLVALSGMGGRKDYKRVYTELLLLRL
jgi:hypothetical protein